MSFFCQYYDGTGLIGLILLAAGAVFQLYCKAVAAHFSINMLTLFVNSLALE